MLNLKSYYIRSQAPSIRRIKFVFLMRAIELPFAMLCAVALVVLFDVF